MVGSTNFAVTAVLEDLTQTTCDQNGSRCQYKMLMHKDGRKSYVGQCNKKEACEINVSENDLTCRFFKYSRIFTAQCFSCCQGKQCHLYAPSLVDATNQATNFFYDHQN